FEITSASAPHATARWASSTLCTPLMTIGPCHTSRIETVVKAPGLSSPCTMECGEGLLTAFGLGFTPHIQGQAGTDLRLRPHPVDTLLHLAIAPVAPFHRIRGGGQQLVVKKRQSLFQGRGKELFEGVA